MVKYFAIYPPVMAQELVILEIVRDNNNISLADLCRKTTLFEANVRNYTRGLILKGMLNKRIDGKYRRFSLTEDSLEYAEQLEKALNHKLLYAK